MRSGIARWGVAALALAMVATPYGLRAQSTGASFLAEFEGHFDGSAQKFVMLAEAMPADAYDWSPGEGVMSVARVYAHIARYNYMYLHENMGLATPVSREAYSRWEDDLTDKDALVRVLRESMEYVRNAVRDMSEDEVGEMTRLYGRDVEQGAVLLQLVAHMNEHLGQSIAYARMNGVVPPWSR